MSEVSIIGIVNSLFKQSSKTFIPVNEAIQNSVQAIEKKKPPNPIIKISVLRKRENIDGFIIEDNGIGFTEKHYESFRCIGSRKKEEIGGKGLGRLSWLPYFEEITIESWYTEPDESHYNRKFSFHLDDREFIRRHYNNYIHSVPEGKGTKLTLKKIRDGNYANKIKKHKDDTIIKNLVRENITHLFRKNPLKLIFNSKETGDFNLTDALAQYIDKKTDESLSFKNVKNVFYLDIYQINNRNFGTFQKR